MLIYKLKSQVKQFFDIKDLGILKYFLGLEIFRNAYGIILNQEEYALELLHEVGLLCSKPNLTPMEQGHEPFNKESLF